MTLLLANWEMILFVILLIIFVGFKVSQFLKTPSEKRQELMLVWLIQAVTIAEKNFGNKTGKVKLSFVYNLFLEKYGVLGVFVSQELFEQLVDKAIKIMEKTFKEALIAKQSK